MLINHKQFFLTFGTFLRRYSEREIEDVKNWFSCQSLLTLYTLIGQFTETFQFEKFVENKYMTSECFLRTNKDKAFSG